MNYKKASELKAGDFVYYRNGMTLYKRRLKNTNYFKLEENSSSFKMGHQVAYTTFEECQREYIKFLQSEIQAAEKLTELEVITVH